MPQELAERLEEIREAGVKLHERLSDLKSWASNAQAVVGIEAEEGPSLQDLARHHQEMLEAMQDLAATLDAWVSMNQLILERYLPQLVKLILEESAE